MLLHIFLGGKQEKKSCFLNSGRVLLVSDFNQNRFDRFIFEGDIPYLAIRAAQFRDSYLSLSQTSLHVPAQMREDIFSCSEKKYRNHCEGCEDVMISYHI